MKKPLPFQATGCCGSSRRVFLADAGMGFTGLVLGAMLARDGLAATPSAVPWSPPDGQPHFTPKAKRVIWIFMLGGVSHLESFDPKPRPEPVRRHVHRRDAPRRRAHRQLHQGQPPAFSHRRPAAHTNQGLPLANRLPQTRAERHRGERLVAPPGAMRRRPLGHSLHVDHRQQPTEPSLQFHTGRHIFDGYLPTIGSWVHYGLGSLNENLPRFIVLGEPPGDCCGGIGTHGAGYLGPANTGVPIEVDPENPLPFASPGPDVFRAEQKREFELLERLHRLSAVEYPDDPKLQARIKSYEFGFPHADRGFPRLCSSGRRESRPAGSMAWKRRQHDPSARYAWRRDDYPSGGCDSCKSITAPRAIAGTPTGR